MGHFHQEKKLTVETCCIHFSLANHKEVFLDGSVLLAMSVSMFVSTNGHKQYS